MTAKHQQQDQNCINGKFSSARRKNDGSIQVAPMYAEEFRSLYYRESAAFAAEKAALEVTRDTIVAIRRDAHRLWQRLSEDLGAALDFEKFTYRATYMGNEVRLVPLEQEKLRPPGTETTIDAEE